MKSGVKRKYVFLTRLLKKPRYVSEVKRRVTEDSDKFILEKGLVSDSVTRYKVVIRGETT